MTLEAIAACGGSARGHPTITDVAIKTGTARAIGRQNTAAGAGAEAGAEVPTDGKGRHSTEGRRAKK